jgi:hypothetical protein
MGIAAFIRWMVGFCSVLPPKAPKKVVVDMGVPWKRAIYKIDLAASAEAAAVTVERTVRQVRRLLTEVLPSSVEELWVSVVACVFVCVGVVVKGSLLLAA